MFSVFVERGELATRSLGFGVYDASDTMVGELQSTLDAATALLEEKTAQPYQAELVEQVKRDASDGPLQ